MNVNLLKEDPDWRWYILVAFICAILVVVPLFFKHLTVSLTKPLTVEFINTKPRFSHTVVSALSLHGVVQPVSVLE